jgi:hypothetical protein
MTSKNLRVARQETLTLVEKYFNKKLKTARDLQIFISQRINTNNLTQEQKIIFQNCFLDARNEKAWKAMNYMIRLIEQG